MDTDHPASVSKACSRCRARKVKCDLKLPRCSACTRLDYECNITERISYSYDAVQQLRDQIAELENRLRAATEASFPTSQQPSQQQQQAATAFAAGQQRVQNTSSAAGRTAQNDDPQQADARLVDCRKEAEEVGILAIGGPDIYSQNKYVGSAAGSTFARIFFKQLGLHRRRSTEHQTGSVDLSPSTAQAALPPRPIAAALLTTYISRVHLWWPLVQLPHLRSVFQRIYQQPAQCSSQDKFAVFIVLALASSERTSSGVDTGSNSSSQGMIDLNSPESYFQTSLWFFNEFHDRPHGLFEIQAVLLLGLWMLNSSSSSHSNDLWQLSRYAMSAAIEAGLHRHNTNWGFSAEELEMRNRTWWCSYNLERQIATLTGRVLSIRDHAIHALLPVPSSFDTLTAAEARAAPVFHRHGVELFRRMVTLRQLGGRILESIYVGRGPDGKCLDTFQEICVRAEQVCRELEQWKRGLDDDSLHLKPSREYAEMKVEHCLLLLLLYQPSPTFMVPSRQMVAVCSKAAASAVHQWTRIEAEFGIAAVCRCFRQLHAVLLVGLAALYCDWQNGILSNKSTPNAHVIYRHEQATKACIGFLDRGISHMKAGNLLRYKDLLQAVRSKVYAKATSVDQDAGPGPGQVQGQGQDQDPGMYVSADSMPAESGSDSANLAASGMQSYMNQLDDFLEVGMFDMDDALDAWYTSMMAEMQNPRPGVSSGGATL